MCQRPGVVHRARRTVDLPLAGRRRLQQRARLLPRCRQHLRAISRLARARPVRVALRKVRDHRHDLAAAHREPVCSRDPEAGRREQAGGHGPARTGRRVHRRDARARADASRDGHAVVDVRYANVAAVARLRHEQRPAGRQGDAARSIEPARDRRDRPRARRRSCTERCHAQDGDEYRSNDPPRQASAHPDPSPWLRASGHSRQRGKPNPEPRTCGRTSHPTGRAAAKTRTATSRSAAA